MNYIHPFGIAYMWVLRQRTVMYISDCAAVVISNPSPCATSSPFDSLSCIFMVDLYLYCVICSHVFDMIVHVWTMDSVINGVHYLPLGSGPSYNVDVFNLHEVLEDSSDGLAPVQNVQMIIPQFTCVFLAL